MAPRRSKNIKINKINYSNLSISDVLCPICRTVLTQPVTLPCNHDFCYSCFEGTMQNANLACPLCRVRIGSWYRIAKKENRLVNEELWKIVREKFSKQLDNKSKGIDEEIVEESNNRSMATPGEIRMEYEQEKRKEMEQLRKEREAEEKASEQLIKKLSREELEYQETVKEEQLKKIKMDEEIAKKLSKEWSKNTKKGPLDQYLNKSQNFATKEYTCRVLYMDKGSDLNEPSTSKGYRTLPFIQKKIQQLQKIVTTDSSDGSDCIEQECRYFKPIDYKHNPPSVGKVPVKVPTKKAVQNKTAQIIGPSGTINFQSNILESAFARFSLKIPETITKSTPKPPTLGVVGAKRKLEDNVTSKPKRQLFQITPPSPKFYGFDNGAMTVKGRSSIRKNNMEKDNLTQVFNEKDAKILQEKTDYEFALKLQKELNQSSQYSTRSQISSSRRPRRQITLDEIVAANTYKVK